MPTILTNKYDLIEAMEANMIAFWSDYARTRYGKVYADAYHTRFLTRVPTALYNGVFGGRFPQKEIAKSVIAETLAYYRLHGVPALWWVIPTFQTIELGSAITEQGGLTMGSLSGMVLDLSRFEGEAPRSTEISVERVKDAATLHEWTKVLVLANDIPEKLLPAIYELEQNRGFSEDITIRYLARLNGAPVATSELSTRAGVAGIFSVATAHGMRRRGLGMRVSAAPLIDAKALGYRYSVLQASEMGFNTYRRLGFETFTSINLYLLQ